MQQCPRSDTWRRDEQRQRGTDLMRARPHHAHLQQAFFAEINVQVGRRRILQSRHMKFASHTQVTHLITPFSTREQGAGKGQDAADVDVSMMQMDDMVALMSLLDADGDGHVSRFEFQTYYQRLKSCSDAAFEAVWTEMDANGDGTLSLSELCAWYGIDNGECQAALRAHKKMDDDRILEALQLQSLVNEERRKQERHQEAHSNRLAALAELAAEMEDDEVPTPAAPRTAAASSPLTMQDLDKLRRAHREHTVEVRR